MCVCVGICLSSILEHFLRIISNYIPVQRECGYRAMSMYWRQLNLQTVSRWSFKVNLKVSTGCWGDLSAT